MVHRSSRVITPDSGQLLRRADAHVHLFTRGWRAASGAYEVAQYNAYRARYAIDAALVVATDEANNDYLSSVLTGRPWLRPLARVDSLKPPSGEALARLLDDGFVGVAMNLAGASEARALEQWGSAEVGILSERCAIVSLTATPAATAELDRFVARLSGVSVLLSHFGLPGRFGVAPNREDLRTILAPLLQLGQRHAHVGIKHSGGYVLGHPRSCAVAAALATAVEAVGVDRLYWGSDFPNALDSITFAESVDLHAAGILGPADIDRVAGANLRDALGRLRPGRAHTETGG